MILDGALQFSGANGDSPTATVTSTNSLDLGIIGLPTSASGGGARDIGIGDDPAMKLLVIVTTTFTSGGSPTMQIQCQGAPDNGSGVAGSFTTMAQSDTIALSLMVAGARLFDIDWPRPKPGQPLPRFIQLNYAIAASTYTAGTLKAYLVLDRHDLPEQANAVLGGYPPGVTIAN